MPGPAVSQAPAEPGEDLPSWAPFTPYWGRQASEGVRGQGGTPSLRCPCAPLSTPGEQLCQQLCTDRWTDCEKGSGETFSVSGLGRKKARNATSSIPAPHM